MMYELTIIRNPAGTFSLVGTGPAVCFYVGKDGSEVSAQHIDDQMRLPSSYRSIKSRVFPTADAAFEYLKTQSLTAAYRP